MSGQVSLKSFLFVALSVEKGDGLWCIPWNSLGFDKHHSDNHDTKHFGFLKTTHDMCVVGLM